MWWVSEGVWRAWGVYGGARVSECVCGGGGASECVGGVPILKRVVRFTNIDEPLSLDIL